MPRGKRVQIDYNVKDPVVDMLKNIDVEKLKEKYQHLQTSISSSIANVYNEAQKLYQQKALNDELLQMRGLYSIQSAYELLRQNGHDLSFRAFGGRIERGTIPSIKIGKKRYIPIEALNILMKIKQDFYSIREAYQIYSKYDPSLNYRAFIGRIEKGSIPSVKINTKRLIPKEVMDAFTIISKNYYTVSQAMDELRKAGINLRRNAFERRLDRKRIPSVKIAGRRYIHKEVLKKVIEKELERIKH